MTVVRRLPTTARGRTPDVAVIHGCLNTAGFGSPLCICLRICKAGSRVFRRLPDISRLLEDTALRRHARRAHHRTSLRFGAADVRNVCGSGCRRIHAGVCDYLFCRFGGFGTWEAFKTHAAAAAGASMQGFATAQARPKCAQGAVSRISCRWRSGRPRRRAPSPSRAGSLRGSCRVCRPIPALHRMT